MPDIVPTLTSAIEMQETVLRASIPDDREAALVALVRAQDRLLNGLDLIQTPPFDPIHGSALINPGGSLAFSLVLQPDPPPVMQPSQGSPRAVAAVLEAATRAASTESAAALQMNHPIDDRDRWASTFLAACADLAGARQVRAHLASGFMRGDVRPDGSLAVWIAQKRFPPAWRERIDLASLDARSRRLAGDAPATGMAWQFGFRPDAIVAGVAARTWTDAVRLLAERHATAPLPDAEILDTLTTALAIEPADATAILSALTLDAANAAWHATVPGIAAAPFVRLGPAMLVPSGFGLRTQPLLFLARELRRRDAQGWHNAAHQREIAFRHDLATVFADKRFVHAPTRIQLKREGGTLRTDIDAAIFDRKTGTLALFELKAQDPFSRSPEELDRRRDSLLAANRQLSGILDWTTRHKPDEILDRIDHQTAKRFHVQRVLPFVLARTLAHFNDGPAPDKRAAWGIWPEVLRLHDAGTLDPAGGNPLQTLFTRLQGWPGDPPIPPDTPPRTLRLGDAVITVSVDRRSPGA
ncbi:MAG TPA: hypothetical protein VNP95_05970 [Thermomicrobiales bacterium]|nr:hypothetical protein [Thermomicrobiales bacterium]